MQEVEIHTEFIKLQQVLKLAGMIGQGSDVKSFLADGVVYVNGQPVTERGKKIRPDDVIEVKGFEAVKVVYSEG
ncbi:hypothetical protein CLNEO_02470 [Anaerotignum neopropionicum]|mgnify:CR=1 FL=1|uniref:Uncharacterized protein n=1 Tax=Anaerotignum neopropionicum TaxID=36847 RepID=A0A136WIH4_9FIRM|nr:RNA-binding S4 domain-containing protein [Anaerotignum neopropionicum]KXL54149.1 hypothetical protein CLNEO_02470 [Anaerotignum neopropionicum]